MSKEPEMTAAEESKWRALVRGRGSINFDRSVPRAIFASLDASRAREAKLVEALLDATAHLTGAASAYRQYAKRNPQFGRVYADALFITRASDFDKAVERAQAVCRALIPTPAEMAGDCHPQGD